MTSIRHKIAIAVSAGALIAAAALPALGATTAGVTATVTPQLVSVSVTDGTVAYGTLAVNTSRGTALNDGDSLDDTQTASNDGNVNQDFNIKGQSSANWTLAATNGNEQYKHEFCTTTCDTTPIFTPLTTSYQALAAGVAPAGTKAFDLKLTTPTATAATTQQSVDVTVQAVAS